MEHLGGKSYFNEVGGLVYIQVIWIYYLPVNLVKCVCGVWSVCPQLLCPITVEQLVRGQLRWEGSVGSCWECGIVGAVAVSWGRAGKQVGWCHMCHPHPLLAVRPEKIPNKNTNNKSATFVIHPSLSVHERKLNIVIYYIFSFEWPAACWYNLWNLFNKWYNICERHDTNMWRTIDLKKNFIHYEIKLIGRSSPDE